MTALLLALLACGGAEPDPDRLAYHASLNLLDDDPVAAAAACTPIQDPVLHGECALFAAAALARSGQDARPTCSGITQSAWREACFFEIADAMQLTGADAREACAGSGQFRDRCLAHALNRLGPQAAQLAPESGAMVQMLAGQARALGLTGRAADDAARDVVAQHLAGQWRERAPDPPAFRRVDCGTADDDTCTKTYRLIVKDVAKQPRPTGPCAAGATREAVEAAGLPGWHDDVAGPAEEMWRGICRTPR